MISYSHGLNFISNTINSPLRFDDTQNILFDSNTIKTKDFNSVHAQLVTSRFIQKITTQFVKHLKDEQTATNQSIEVIAKIFEIKEDDN